MYLNNDEKNQSFIESDKIVGAGNFRRTVYIITYYTMFSSMSITQKTGIWVSHARMKVDHLKQELNDYFKSYKSLKESGQFPYTEIEYKKQIKYYEERISFTQNEYIKAHEKWLKLSGNDIIE